MADSTGSTAKLTIREQAQGEKTIVYVSDGVDEVGFTKYKNGIYYYGKQKIKDAVEKNKTFLQGLGLTPSALGVIISVSENEGNLDAINTWDNSFMTFGMFQWTIGVDINPGELAALLERIKETDPELFKNYYGRYGLDVELTNKTSGYIILDGKKLVTGAEKELLRTNEWAYYFWKSGQDPKVQSIQVEHALSRIGTFYKSESYKPNGYYISDLVTSEYGVALVLDNHVNRPGYVAPCLAQAMKQARLVEPDKWETAQEGSLLDEYIKIRATYGHSPMTDADKRAAAIKKYLDNGTISGARGSYLVGLDREV
ncbi:MAG: binding 1 protein [Acidobacteriota bacterium]|nr:binding 1 protein [Acidobacteriota bacterium]